MPGGDRTGPAGMGPMTGRGAGYCAGFGVPGFMNRGMGRGFGRGRGWGMGYGRGMGRGWGWRNWQAAPGFVGGPVAAPTREQEIEMLRQESEDLKASLDQIHERIAELEK